MSEMSREGATIGMLVTCQRCGAQTFRKQIGYSSVDAAMRNRHSFYDVFEPMPDGWKTEHNAGGWLCPTCAKEFEELNMQFMQNIRGRGFERRDTDEN